MATPKIAFIQAQWHEDITDNAKETFIAKIGDKGEVSVHVVPGALEMPLAAQKLARSGDYAAIVCCAFVVDGGIYRHEFVAQAVLDGIMRVNLDEGVPVLSASLTPHHYHENKDQRNFFRKHLKTKGEEAADGVAQLLGLTLDSIKPKAQTKPE